MTRLFRSPQKRQPSRVIKHAHAIRLFAEGLVALAAVAVVTLPATWGGSQAASAARPSFLQRDPGVEAAASVIAGAERLRSAADLEAVQIASLLAPVLSHRRAQTITIGRGDHIVAALQKAGVVAEDVNAAAKAFAEVYDPRKLFAGQTITLYLDQAAADAGARLIGLAFEPETARTIQLSRVADGGFLGRDLAPALERRVARASGVITESLYADAVRAGAHDRSIAEIASLLAYTVDFQREIRAGDAFEIVFEEWVTAEGRPVKAGALYYVGFNPSGRELKYWLFPNKTGEAEYFDAKGESAKRFLMKTPINGARLSSHFGKRRHPVLGYTKLHKGTDFAAPRGTPIYAAGEGVIERANRFGTFGNYVAIKHSNGYKTAYAHMNGFGKGIRSGVRVKQGQVIGYVGTTGRSTGPHLHYEVHKNGVAVNPMNIKAPTGRTLSEAERIEFDVQRAFIDALRDRAIDANPDAVQVAER